MLSVFRKEGTLVEQIMAALGFKKIDPTVTYIEQRINFARNLSNPLYFYTVAHTAKMIRRNRFIRVCCVCKRYEVHGEWVKGKIPKGNQTHTYCPVCYEELKKEIKILKAESNKMQ